jgi:hemoglobin-like flavoprotein
MMSPTSRSVTMTGAQVPPMLPEQVAELRRSWQLVAPMAEEAAQLFYARLFELDPSLRTLFHTDMAVQRRKLIDALSFIVDHADRPDELQPMLGALGERHLHYGVRPEHYTTVGEALLWMLDEGLGALCTTEARDAWVVAYECVASAMQAPARDSTPTR